MFKEISDYAKQKISFWKFQNILNNFFDGELIKEYYTNRKVRRINFDSEITIDNIVYRLHVPHDKSIFERSDFFHSPSKFSSEN